MITNILAPMLLTNKLVSLSRQRGMPLRIVNITSGAANDPLAGWSVYSTGKFAAKFFFQCLALEWPEVAIANIDPGVLNTDMQRRIRLSSDADFPDRPRFVQFHADNKLRDPSEAAEKILYQEHLI